MKTKEYLNSTCRASVEELRGMAEKAISFIESHPHLFACRWEGEAGDWIPSEDDGEWRQDAYGSDMGRTKNGEEWVRFFSVDRDGNSETSSEFHKSPGKAWHESETREWDYEMATSNALYNLLKMELYNLHVAETGDDPLGNTIGKNDPATVHSKGIAHDIPDLCASVYRMALDTILKKS